MSNELVHSLSPYLLQHAHNPVHWKAWSKKWLDHAKEQNKPILISIGYSACHWCHVMEKECFEKQEVADLMNKYFINIKIDREERPDIDQIYMDAIQLMGIRGGWPLNVFLTPEGKPFYGGTYFPKEKWMHLLHQIHDGFANHRTEIETSAEKFTEGIQKTDIEKYQLHADYALKKEDLALIYERLSKTFDPVWGGFSRTPKFPLPCTYLFLLRLHKYENITGALDHTLFTLKKMALGGLYDTLAGGFSRYSTDEMWLAPHFEKMLYDNAQLIRVYAEAYQVNQDPFFMEVALQSIQFLNQELKHPKGGYFSALDADTEGEEGKFYVWSWEEIVALAGPDLSVIQDYFQLSEDGNWEEKNILWAQDTLISYSHKKQLKRETVIEKIKLFKSKAIALRKQRTKPGLDFKILASWNGLMLTALCQVAKATEDLDIKRNIKIQCEELARFIDIELLKDAILLHQYAETAGPYDNFSDHVGANFGFLDDYACVIEGWLQWYQISMDTYWLDKALYLIELTLTHFYDESDGLFYYTDERQDPLIGRKKEIFDQVIPSSNSIMAMQLWLAGKITGHTSYIELCTQMCQLMHKIILHEPSFMCHWGVVYQHLIFKSYEIAVSGTNPETLIEPLQRAFSPHLIFIGDKEGKENLDLIKNRQGNKDLYYVCSDGTCQLPTSRIQEVVAMIGQ